MHAHESGGSLVAPERFALFLQFQTKVRRGIVRFRSAASGVDTR